MGCCCSREKDDPALILEYAAPDPDELSRPILSDHERNDGKNGNVTTPIRRRGSSKLFEDALTPPPPTTHIVKRGHLYKEGHKRKNWTKRYFILSAGVLSYYENMLEDYPYSKGFKGHIALRDAKVSTFIAKDMRLRLLIENSSSSNEAGKATLLIKGSNDKETNTWAKAVAEELDKTNGKTSRKVASGEMQDVTGEDSVKARSASIMKSGTGVLKSGWGKKKGSVVKNWKLRYFVLADGWLTYYAKGPPHVSDKKGQLPMDGCLVHRNGEKGIKITSPVQGRKLLIEFDEEKHAEEWCETLETAVETIGSIRVTRFEA